VTRHGDPLISSSPARPVAHKEREGQRRGKKEREREKEESTNESPREILLRSPPEIIEGLGVEKVIKREKRGMKRKRDQDVP